MSFGRDLVPKNVQFDFNSYLEVQNAVEPPCGCGSLIHSAWSKSYSPEYSEKQELFIKTVKDAKQYLEIGTFEADSLLLLLSNNKEVKATCIDICESKGVEISVNILNRTFGYRANLIKGSSWDVLPRVLSSNHSALDVLFVDGCHEFLPVFSDIYWCLQYRTCIHRQCTCCFDDVDNIQVERALQVLSVTGDEQTNNLHCMAILKPDPLPPPPKRIVLATCLYDLGIDSRRSIDDYVAQCGWLSRIKVPVYLFTEPGNGVKNMFPSRYYPNLTIVEIPLSDTRFWKYLHRVKSNMKSFTVHNADPIKDTAEIACLYHNKFFFLEEVMNREPDATHVGWIDLGIGKNVDAPELVALLDPPDAISHCTSNPFVITLTQLSHNLTEIFQYYWHHVLGSFFTGSRANMQWYIKVYEEMLNEILEGGLHQMDEALMAVISNRYPDRFRMYYGDYQDLMQNYKYALQNHDFIMNMVQRCLDVYQYEEANRILDYLKPTCLYHPPVRERFVRLCIVSRFYREPRTLDTDILTELGEPWAKNVVVTEQNNLQFYNSQSSADCVIHV